MQKLPSVEPVTITWDDVFYQVKTLKDDGKKEQQRQGLNVKKEKKEKKEKVMVDKVILNKLGGMVQPGQALAIMGPSGSGKTSLLNVLSRRIRVDHNNTPFNVQINGHQINEEISRKYGAFVPQEDVMSGTLTPREALMFNAHLRLPASVSLEEKKRRIESLLAELGLTKVADSLIGFTGQDAINTGLKKSLSGGERKRLSIALELITNPSLIYLDEPTTGLDSFSALSVVNTLGRLAAAGRTVIYTIHQPSDEIFEQFDRLLLLGLGRVIYQGAASQAIPYFKATMGYRVKRFENPADFLLKIVHVDPGRVDGSDTPEEYYDDDSEHEEETKLVFDVAARQVDILATAFAKSKEQADLSDARTNLKVLVNPQIESQFYRAGFFRQCSLLISRQLKNLVREPMQMAGATFQAIFFAVIMGLIFKRLGHSQRNARDRLGVIFFATVFQMFGALLGPLYLFPAERNVFMREQQNGLYNIGAYYLSRVIAELPKTLFSPLLFSSIFYWLVGLNPSGERFLIFLCIAFLQASVGFAFGILTVAILPDPAVAMSVIPVAFIPMFLLSGFYLRTNSIPKYFIPFEYGIAFTKYSYHAMVHNEMKGTEFYCTDEEFVNSGNFCPYTRGEQVIAAEDLDWGSIGLDALILAIFTVGFHLLAFLILRRSALKSK